MYRSPFFETFFADSELEHPEPDVSSAAGLQGQVQTLTRNVFDLQLVVASLIETLHKIELADPAKLRATVEEELARVRKTMADKAAEHAKAVAASRPPTVTPPPSIGHQAAQGTTTCDKCKKVVPMARTTITADGTVCDLCAAGLPA